MKNWNDDCEKEGIVRTSAKLITTEVRHMRCDMETYLRATAGRRRQLQQHVSASTDEAFSHRS